MCEIKWIRGSEYRGNYCSFGAEKTDTLYILMKVGACMETIYLSSDNLKEWQQKAKSNVMALGFFDGIHYGHLEVIQTALRIARGKKSFS